MLTARIASHFWSCLYSHFHVAGFMILIITQLSSLCTYLLAEQHNASSWREWLEEHPYMVKLRIDAKRFGRRHNNIYLNKPRQLLTIGLFQWVLYVSILTGPSLQNLFLLIMIHNRSHTTNKFIYISIRNRKADCLEKGPYPALLKIFIKLEAPEWRRQ
jgi:hypothetical protein